MERGPMIPYFLSRNLIGEMFLDLLENAIDQVLTNALEGYEGYRPADVVSGLKFFQGRKMFGSPPCILQKVDDKKTVHNKKNHIPNVSILGISKQIKKNLRIIKNFPDFQDYS